MNQISSSPNGPPSNEKSGTPGAMNEGDRHGIDALLARCSESLLATYGLAIERAGAADALSRSASLAVVRFAGEQMHGTLLLDASPALLARTYPASGGATSESDLYDWLAELANLLLGRIKRELVGRGVVIQLGTPTLVSGDAVPFGAEPHNTVIVCQLGAEMVWAQARLEVEVEAHFSLPTEELDKSSLLPDQGDWFMFDE